MIKITILALEYVVLWAVTWVLIAAGSNDVHKHMTIEELKHTFYVDQHNLVPEYEVVHIHHLTSRSASATPQSTDPTINGGTTYRTSQPEMESKRKRKKFGDKATDHGKYHNVEDVDKTKIRLKAFGKPLDLTLTKTEGLFKKSGLKIWIVEPNATSQHGVEYVEIPSETHEDIGEIYQDVQNQAALLLRTDETLGHVIVTWIMSAIFVRPAIKIRKIDHRLLNNRWSRSF